MGTSSRLRRAGLSALLVFACEAVGATPMACRLGTARCFESQGVIFTADEGIVISDACLHFTQNDLGRTALKLSVAELNRRSPGKVTALDRAHYDFFSDLYPSRLPFRRPPKAEDTSYDEVKRACERLSRDFDNEAKWIR